jgi:AraC-like DNA-binding protein
MGLTGGRAPLPEAIDYAAAVFVRGVRTVTGDKARVLDVRLARPRPQRTEGYRRAFGAAVNFDAEENAVVFGEAELRAPFRDNNPRLRTILAQRADDVLDALPETPTLESQVRANIRRRLTYEPLGLDAIAADLGMSERTVRRRLRDSGQTYRALLDSVRSERAVALVDERRHTVAAIAQLVGFADPTAFARAFRRWTGSAPHEYVRRGPPS